MAVDITLLFKASVKTVKTRNKALGVALDNSSKDELFRKIRPKGDFNVRAKEVICNIGKLKDFLLEHRKDYVNAGSHIASEFSRMTDTERDQIDQDAQIFMRTCADAIQQLRTEGVCKLYSEQRAIRVKRVVDKKRLSRLQPEQSNKSRTAPENVLVNSTDAGEEMNFDEEATENNLPETLNNFGLWEDGKGEDELSPEEIQMVHSSSPPASDDPGHSIAPGTWVLVRNFQRTNNGQPRWTGPYLVLLSTRSAVRVEGKKNWVHGTHCKRVPLPLPYDRWVNEGIADSETESIPRFIPFSDARLKETGTEKRE
ncbi:syntaxin-18 isoform X3 [Lissotriton helveticus]